MHDIAQAAADAAEVPDFGAIARRGERRRNMRNGVTAGAAAFAVATTIGAVQLLGSDGGTTPEPAPSPPTTVPHTDRSRANGPERIVDHEDAHIADAAVSPDGSSVAVMWSVVNGGAHGLAASADGWATRAVWGLPIPGDVIAAGEDAFLMRDDTLGKLWVVDPDGGRRPVEVAGAESPVADGELPVAMSDGLVAVDPGTATAHPVNTPNDLFGIVVYGGRLSATSTDVTGGEVDVVTYRWSDDGGASWESETFEKAWDSVEHIVPTEAGTDHALAISTGREEIKPLGSVLTLPADGGSFTETAYDGELATIAGAFVVDGQIRFLGDLWGTSSSPQQSGLYRWADGVLELIDDGSDVTGREGAAIVDVVAAPDGSVVVLADGSELFRSVDGGISWEEIAAR